VAGLIVRTCGMPNLNAGDLINESTATQRNYLKLLNGKKETILLDARLNVLPRTFSSQNKTSGAFGSLLLSPPEKKIILATVAEQDMRQNYRNKPIELPALIYGKGNQVYFMVLGNDGVCQHNFLQAQLKTNPKMTYTLILPESMARMEIIGREMSRYLQPGDLCLELLHNQDNPHGRINFLKIGQEPLSASISVVSWEIDLPGKTKLVIDAILKKSCKALNEWFSQRKLPLPWLVHQ